MELISSDITSALKIMFIYDTKCRGSDLLINFMITNTFFYLSLSIFDYTNFIILLYQSFALKAYVLYSLRLILIALNHFKYFKNYFEYLHKRFNYEAGCALKWTTAVRSVARSAVLRVGFLGLGIVAAAETSWSYFLAHDCSCWCFAWWWICR